MRLGPSHGRCPPNATTRMGPEARERSARRSAASSSRKARVGSAPTTLAHLVHEPAARGPISVRRLPGVNQVGSQLSKSISLVWPTSTTGFARYVVGTSVGRRGQQPAAISPNGPAAARMPRTSFRAASELSDIHHASASACSAAAAARSTENGPSMWTMRFAPWRETLSQRNGTSLYASTSLAYGELRLCHRQRSHG